jgi:hypothetical protein
MSNDTRQEIIDHMAAAFLASAAADCEAAEVEIHFSGGDPAADRAAVSLAEEMETLNGLPLSEIMATGEGGDHPCNPEYFGHYAAMQSMGHGVGLESVGLDSHGRDATVKVPSHEFTHYHLDTPWKEAS